MLDSFRLKKRLHDFIGGLRNREFIAKTLVIYLAIWLFTFPVLIFPSFLGGFLSFLLTIVHIVFWIRLVNVLHTKLNPPNELLLIAAVLLYLLETIVLSAAVDGIALRNSAVAILQIPQILILALLVLVISLLVFQGSSHKKNSLFLLVVVALMGLSFVTNEHSVLHFILQFVLLIVFLRRVLWLETLTKEECWLYLIVAFSMFRWVGNFDPYEIGQPLSFVQSDAWYGWPKLLFYALKMYLLAMLIKIPIVLVYNFASLSRKLKISSLFQSSFPQLFQIVMLLIIFYFLVVGIQAEKLRHAVFQTVAQFQTEAADLGQSPLKLKKDDWQNGLEIPGYQPLEVPNQLPEHGILGLMPKSSFGGEADYFIFSHADSSENGLFLTPIDSSFIAAVGHRLSILVGTRLVAYPYEPPGWESRIYDLSLGDLSFWGEKRNLQIFPFGFEFDLPQGYLSTTLIDRSESPGWQNDINQFLRNFKNIPVGRVITEVIGGRGTDHPFYAMDITMTPVLHQFSLTLLAFMVFLSIVYFLVNLLITSRMVKVGADINNMIVQKFNQLRNGIREIAEGNLDYKVRVDGQDEFVELAERFNKMGDELKRSIDEAREKERLHHELAIARKVQLDLLPHNLPKTPGFDIAATLNTATEVGGDFYDVIDIDGKRFLFTIGDVSGKGTSAAFYMAQCISLIRYSHQFAMSPKEITNRINKYFSDPLVDKRIFITAVIGLLDTEKSTITFVRAGHTEPMFYPGDPGKEPRCIQSHGMGIGLDRSGSLFEKATKEHKLTLKDGDTLVFYTDGVEEAARKQASDTEGEEKLEDNQQEEMVFYTTERLRAKLDEVRGRSSESMLQAITDDIHKFYGHNSRVDDYTLLIIRKSPELK